MIYPVKSCGLIGLGRMGFRLAQRLRDIDIGVTGFDISEDRNTLLRSEGFRVSDSCESLCADLASPRLIMVILPSGEATNSMLLKLAQILKPGDTLFDLGNCHYQKAREHEKMFQKMGVDFLDIGVSGGVTGARNGPMLSAGGEPEIFKKWEPMLKALAGSSGCVYAGPSGWGHLTKTIHNGIEYGFLQAIAEGLHLLEKSAEKDGITINLKDICNAWSSGSIIESRLIKDAALAVDLLENKNISGNVGGGETGRWASEVARELKVPTPALKAALEFRETSVKSPDRTGQFIAAIRNIFGEHNTAP